LDVEETPEMKHALSLFFALLLIPPMRLAAAEASPPVPRPNIVLILADDLGYGDLGCYGSETIATPRIDRMAREGLRFTDFYVAAPFCSPSRAALLTGRLPARCGVPYVLFPTEQTGLPPREVTLAELLKPAGYATACVGKWHLGWRRELRPQRQGFDEYFGLLHTNDAEEWRTGEPFRQLGMMEPLSLREGDRVVEAPVDQSLLTRRYTERALDFIRRHRDRPFFLYLAHTMPHIPQYASPAFAGRSRDGVYGDAVEELDWSTGQVLDLLHELKLAERTLVIFTSDNGANLRSRKPNPNARFPGRSFGGSNGPLRGGKGTTFEGGIRVPCLAWWPGTIPAGRTDSAPASALDFFPTFGRLCGAPPPADVTLDGEDITPRLYGKSPSAEPGSEPRALFHYFGVQLQAVREGPWKLIVPVGEYPKVRVPSLWFEHQAGLFERQHRLWPRATLFDLADDPGEQADVAAAHPDVVARLLEKARGFDRAFQERCEPVLYLPGPRPPAAGQVRAPGEDLGAWVELMK
jgi:arylsulfatase A